MKSEDLLRAIGDIDESYIAEADSGSVRRTQRWRRYTGWIITAAAAVLVILISVKMLRPVRKSEQLSSANAVAENRAEKEKTAGADYDAMKTEAEEAADYDVAEEAAVEEAADYNVAEEAAVEEAADYNVAEEAAVEEATDYDVAEEAAVEEDTAYEAAAGAMTGDHAAFTSSAGTAADADTAFMAAAGTEGGANEASGQRYTFEISSTREADTAEQGEWLDLAGKHILIEKEGGGIRRARWENENGSCTLTAEGEPFTRVELEQLLEELA